MVQKQCVGSETDLQLLLELFLEHHLALERRLQLALAAHLRGLSVMPPAQKVPNQLDHVRVLELKLCCTHACKWVAGWTLATAMTDPASGLVHCHHSISILTVITQPQGVLKVNTSMRTRRHRLVRRQQRRKQALATCCNPALAEVTGSAAPVSPVGAQYTTICRV